MANTLREEGALDEHESFIAATFPMAKGGGDAVCLTKRGKDMHILAIVDRHGLPLSVRAHAAHRHEVTPVQLSFDFSMLEANPEQLTGDRVYDSDQLDEDLRQDGVAIIALHRSSASSRLRTVGIYGVTNAAVQRFFAWLQWKRCLLIRRECYATNFLGFGATRVDQDAPSTSFEVGSSET